MMGNVGLIVNFSRWLAYSIYLCLLLVAVERRGWSQEDDSIRITESTEDDANVPVIPIERVETSFRLDVGTVPGGGEN